MSFDSVTFWLFFAVAFAAWRVLPFAAAKAAMVVASLLFYGWWDVRFVPLILFSSVLDYVAGARIHAASERRVARRWLTYSLAGNLGLLGVFKYTPFVAENVRALLGSEGAGDAAFADWIVPVGISFYTFQTLSYSIDIYRGQLAPSRSYRDFLLYVAFFPQLVAGPIVRARKLLPQLTRRRRLSLESVQAGLFHIVLGLFLKVVVADNLAPEVERAFDRGDAATLTPVGAWLAVLYFAVQIFADFAGYSGIAIGLALVMGLRFPENFRAPYIARSLSEFWRRWHISLSEWLRDYLYIPLGGSRRGRGRTLACLMVTMLLGGLWHGASWNFVIWGGLHGLGLCVERVLRGSRATRSPVRPDPGVSGVLVGALRMAGVFVFVLTTWVFFRAHELELAGTFLARMFVAPLSEPLGLEALAEARHLVLVLPVVLLHLARLSRDWYGVEARPVLTALASGAMLFLLTIVQRDAPAQFIYFQF